MPLSDHSRGGAGWLKFLCKKKTRFLCVSTSIIINSLRHRLIITRWANFFVLLSRFGLSALYLHCTPDPTRAGLASLHRCTLYSQRFVLWSCYCNCTAVEIWFNSHRIRIAICNPPPPLHFAIYCRHDLSTVCGQPFYGLYLRNVSSSLMAGSCRISCSGVRRLWIPWCCSCSTCSHTRTSSSCTHNTLHVGTCQLFQLR